MKILIDGVELLTLTETQKKVIQSGLGAEIFDNEIKRILKWILLDQRYQLSFNALRDEWIEKLSKRYTTIPTNQDELAKLIFSQPDYKDRTTSQEKTNV